MTSATPVNTSTGWRAYLPRFLLAGSIPTAREVITSSALPAPLATLVTDTVRRTRLWPRERSDLARELCSHFAEGLALGRTPEQLVTDFGDAHAAARLIRRAKKRARPRLLRALIAVYDTALILTLVALALYVVLALRYFNGAPAISHNYLADLNRNIQAVPIADRAWPIYQRALESLPPIPEELSKNWGAIRPSDPRWSSVTSYIASAQQSIPLILEASAKPHLGAEIRPLTEAPVFHPAAFDHLSKLSSAAALLREDATRATATRDAGTLVADLTALLHLSEQTHETPCLISDTAALKMIAGACDTLGTSLATDRELIPSPALVNLAHTLASLRGGGDFRITANGDEALFRDIIQHVYTDDGHGDGRLTAVGQNVLEFVMGNWFSDAPLNEQVMKGPITGTFSPGRRAVIVQYDRLSAQILAGVNKPLYARDGEQEYAAFTRIYGSASAIAGCIVPRPETIAGAFMPAYAAVATDAERTTQRRDAMLVAIALEFYRRQHGTYPSSLAEMTPALLPAVPLDRFDGKPIKYRLDDAGCPLVYSVGANLADDGGATPPPGDDPTLWFLPQMRNRQWRNPMYRNGTGPAGDWILWPAPTPDPAILNPHI